MPCFANLITTTAFKFSIADWITKNNRFAGLIELNRLRSTDAFAFSHWSNSGNDTLVMRRVVASIHTHWTRARATATSSASICMMSRSSKVSFALEVCKTVRTSHLTPCFKFPGCKYSKSSIRATTTSIPRSVTSCSASGPPRWSLLERSNQRRTSCTEGHGDANSSLAGTTVTRGSLVKAGHLDEKLGSPASPERTTKSWAETHTASVRDLTRQSCPFSESSVWSGCF